MRCDERLIAYRRIQDGGFEVVEGTQMNISRVAYKNNTSKYLINGTVKYAVAVKSQRARLALEHTGFDNV